MRGADAGRARFHADAANRHPLKVGIFSFFGGRIVFAAEFFSHGNEHRHFSAQKTHSWHGFTFAF